MRAKGWVGSAIEVLEHNGSPYVINGHHRLEGARRAGIDVPYRALTEAEIRAYGFSGIDQVIWASLEVAPDKL
jgi:ParB-like chromosome segregation protein Spo0J